MDETILRRAVFDEKLRAYWFWQGAFVLLVTVAGIPFLPVWFLGYGQFIGRKQFERLQCVLTERSLHVLSGYLFRTEKTVPLDKIQDLSLHEGPILRWLGLAALKVETAGSSGAQGQADASLVGVIDAPAFRDAVLSQRDAVAPVGGGRPIALAATGGSGGADAATLADVRDSLHRIERLLERGLEQRSS